MRSRLSQSTELGVLSVRRQRWKLAAHHAADGSQTATSSGKFLAEHLWSAGS